MEKCKDGEHLWIVIGWAGGTYDQHGQFVRRHAQVFEDMRAREFMCQRCGELRDAEELLPPLKPVS